MCLLPCNLSIKNTNTITDPLSKTRLILNTCLIIFGFLFASGMLLYVFLNFCNIGLVTSVILAVTSLLLGLLITQIGISCCVCRSLINKFREEITD